MSGRKVRKAKMAEKIKAKEDRNKALKKRDRWYETQEMKNAAMPHKIKIRLETFLAESNKGTHIDEDKIIFGDRKIHYKIIDGQGISIDYQGKTAYILLNERFVKNILNFVLMEEETYSLLY